jgi:hypothetical protein
VAPKNTGPPPTKVQARLLSARALAAGVTHAVDDLRATVLPKETVAEVDADQDMEEAEPVKVSRSARPVMIMADDDSNEGEDEEEEGGEEEDAAGWESGSVDGEGDGEADDGWESGSVLSDAPPAKKVAVAKQSKVAKSTKPVVTPVNPTPASSQFLPSLAVGFVRGGSSDSDLEDVGDADGGGDRKNRRGQRARRACVFTYLPAAVHSC